MTFRLATWSLLSLLAVACSSGKVSSGAPGPYMAGATDNGTGVGSCQGDRDCDDGNYCNGVETCQRGYCRYGAAVECDDGVDCTRDACDEASNRCQSTPDHRRCGDGSVCDTTVGCQAGTACDSDDDCDDGVFCNGRETCGEGSTCLAGESVTCEDGNDCTVDVCSEEGRACSHLITDIDGDGHGDAACRGGTDCDDEDPAVNPGAREVCGDGVDNDCDRDRDCDDAQCVNSAQCEGREAADGDRARARDGDEICDDGRDNDGDRDVDCRDDDCDGNRACQDRGGRDAGRGDRNGRDPCVVNGWYDDGDCDDVCWRRDPDCGAGGRGQDDERWGRDRGWGRDRNQNQRRDADRNAGRNQGRGRGGVDDRRAAGECGRTTTAGRCEGDKTVVACTGEGRNERLVRRECTGTEVCRVTNGLAACAAPNRAVPAAWTCNATYYGTRDGCDCTCGAVDPDCGVAGQEVLGCEPGQTCDANARCTSQSRVAAGWTCNASYYGTRDGCDCGCGVRDPDCDVAGQAVYNCSEGQTCGANGACTAGRAGSAGGPPAGWNEAACNAAYYNDDNGCDCGCGVRDPDCDAGPDTNEGRVIGCLEGQGCDAQGECTYQETQAPAGWNTDVCQASWYDADDGCDCGCGVLDPDCDGGGCATLGCSDDACGYCYDGTGSSACEAAEEDAPPAGWTCLASWYGDDDCDCNCGAQDSDCTYSECDAQQDEAPAGWTCNAAWYGDNDCDCNCGVQDSDCTYSECDAGADVPAGWTCNVAWYGDNECDCNCGAQDSDCGYADCEANNAPVGWTCNDAWYGDNECDCGCGADDIDCGYSECNGSNAPYGWTCNDAWYGDNQCDCGCGADDSDCGYGDCSDPGGGGGAPAGWLCNESWYGDNQCDCGCGADDIDCGWNDCTESV